MYHTFTVNFIPFPDGVQSYSIEYRDSSDSYGPHPVFRNFGVGEGTLYDASVPAAIRKTKDSGGVQSKASSDADEESDEDPKNNDIEEQPWPTREGEYWISETISNGNNIELYNSTNNSQNNKCKVNVIKD